MNEDYSNREIDMKFEGVHEKLDLILEQTTRHNGRLTKVERILLILGCITATLLISKPEIINLVKLII